MIQLKESITVSKDIHYVFDYVSDFSNIQLWDPGVESSCKARPGKTGQGSVFDLVLKFGLSRPEMSYTIIEYHSFEKVILQGTSENFSATDTICFKEIMDGTQIDYQADIRFSGLLEKLEFLMKPVLKKTGKNAMAGLEKALDSRPRGAREKSGKNAWPASGSGVLDYLADHAVLPGMLMFSRFGYLFSRLFWSESGTTLSGKNVVLTGGTSGIGKAAAFRLSEKNASLTILARDHEKARKITREITEKTGNPDVDFLIADLSCMKNIRHVATQLKHRKKKIDVLINNAGALFNDRNETGEGFEKTFATDLLGVFYLTRLLKEPLAASGSARIINVASGGMYTQKIDVHDLENKTVPYNGAKAYARAKRGIVILTEIWAEKFKKFGITVHSMHPGWVDTPGIEKSLPGFHARLKKILRTPDQGADTIVWLAMSKSAGRSSGRFWLDRRPHETVVLPGTGESAAERKILWEKLTAQVSGL